MFVDPDGRKAYNPEPVIDNVPRGGLWDFHLNGGYRYYTSFSQFLGGDSYFYTGAGSSGGGGDGEDRTPKRNGDPNSNIFRSSGNFFNRYCSQHSSENRN